MAGIDFLVHRLLTFFLTKTRFKNEEKTIRETARYTGYSPMIEDKMICKT